MGDAEGRRDPSTVPSELELDLGSLGLRPRCRPKDLHPPTGQGVLQDEVDELPGLGGLGLKVCATEGGQGTGEGQLVPGDGPTWEPPQQGLQVDPAIVPDQLRCAAPSDLVAHGQGDREALDERGLGSTQVETEGPKDPTELLDGEVGEAAPRGVCDRGQDGQEGEERGHAEG